MSKKTSNGDSARGFQHEFDQNTVCGQLILIGKNKGIVL